MILITFPTGQADAMRMARADEFDIVLPDLRMPGMEWPTLKA